MNMMSQQAIVGGPHAHAGASVTRTMVIVMIALTPATLFGLYQFGWPAIFLFTVTVGSAILAEAAALHVAGKPVKPFLMDGSAALSGWLIAMTLPPWAPWWIGVLGAVVAIVLAKHAFGGLGQNLFNPAMVARVMLLISFPLEMTRFLAPQPLGASDSPGFLEGLKITFFGHPDFDAISSASVLSLVQTELGRGKPLDEILSSAYDPLGQAIGIVPGSLGETSALLVLVGGLFLLAMRTITWHAPVAMTATVALLSGVFHIIDPTRYPDPLFHIVSGTFMLGAFFIVTDYVTAPVTPLGRIIFGAGCGALTFIIRSWAAFPEGMGFAVLLMNTATPVIDHYVRPRIYGRTRKGAPLKHDEE